MLTLPIPVCLARNRWYDLLEPVTFKTEFFSLTPKDGELFRDGYLEYEGFVESHRAAAAESGGAAAARTQFVPSEEISSRVAALAARMQTVVDRVNGGTQRPVFVKTSCRSAKDAPTSQFALQAHFNRLADEAAAEDDNALIGCMLEAGLELLKVYSAEEAGANELM